MVSLCANVKAGRFLDDALRDSEQLAKEVERLTRCLERKNEKLAVLTKTWGGHHVEAVRLFASLLDETVAENVVADEPSRSDIIITCALKVVAAECAHRLNAGTIDSDIALRLIGHADRFEVRAKKRHTVIKGFS